MDRWGLLAMLLRPGEITARGIEKEITAMDRKELEEGVIEYFLFRKRLNEIIGSECIVK